MQHSLEPDPMIELIAVQGTREAITNGILSEYMDSVPLQSKETEILQQYANCLFDTIVEEYSVRSDEENVYIMPKQYETTQNFITPAKTYYISIKKSTLILLSIFSKLLLSHTMGSIAGDVISAFIEAQFPQEDLALIHRLDSASGEVCLLMEAAREKNGINKNCLSGFHGECINNDLPCGFRQADRCRCDKKQVVTICEQLVKDRILRKDGRRYYYTDFI